MDSGNNRRSVALWAVSPDGYRLGRTIAAAMPEAVLFASESAASGRDELKTGQSFSSLRSAVAEHFQGFSGHVFVMSAGIAVRMIAPWIGSKTADPAVVVVDDLGRHCISLLSGHLGGANDLARHIAALTGARPVITTATDIRGLPAIDVLARAKGLHIDNPGRIKTLNMAILNRESIRIHDPYGLIGPDLEKAGVVLQETAGNTRTGLVVDDRLTAGSGEQLVLRPRSLVAGIGCNRGTEAREILEALSRVCRDFDLSEASLACLASVDLKQDEAGLLAAADELECNLVFYSRSQLAGVTGIKTPSPTVEQWIGVTSVCEAAAIQAANGEPLIVPKQKLGNVTVALSRQRPPFLSWALDPETPIISRNGPWRCSSP